MSFLYTQYPNYPVYTSYNTPASQWTWDQLYLWSPLIIFSVILACICALVIIILISIMIYNLCAYGTCCCPTFGSFCCADDCGGICCCCCPGAGPVRKRKLILFNNDDNCNNSVRVRRPSRVVTIEEPDERLSRAGSIRSIRSVRVKEAPIYIQNSRRPSYADMPRIQTYSVRPAPAPVTVAPPRIVTQDIYRTGPSLSSGSNLRYVQQGNISCAPSVMSGFGMVGNAGAGNGGGDLRVVVRNYPMQQSSSSQIIHTSCPPAGNQMSNDQYGMASFGNQGQGYSNNGYTGGGGMYDSFSQDGGQHSAIIDVANNQSYSAPARIVELNDDHVSYPTLPQYYD